MIGGIIQLLLNLLFPVALAATAPSLEHVSVQALQNQQVVSTMTADGATVINQVQYTGLESFSEPNDTTELSFQGDSLPSGTLVTITIPEAQLAATAMVSAAGHWQVTLPTTTLPAGKHTVYMTTSDATTTSASLAVAQFTVHTTQALSQSTWIFLLSTFIAIVCLLLAITIQLHYNTSHYSVV